MLNEITRTFLALLAFTTVIDSDLVVGVADGAFSLFRNEDIGNGFARR